MTALGTLTTTCEKLKGWVPNAFWNTVFLQRTSPLPEFPRTSLYSSLFNHCYFLYSKWRSDETIKTKQTNPPPRQGTNISSGKRNSALNRAPSKGGLAQDSNQLDEHSFRKTARHHHDPISTGFLFIVWRPDSALYPWQQREAKKLYTYHEPEK